MTQSDPFFFLVTVQDVENTGESKTEEMVNKQVFGKFGQELVSENKNENDNTDACSTISNISSVSYGSSNCSSDNSTTSKLPKLKLEIPILPITAENLKNFGCQYLAPNEKFEINTKYDNDDDDDMNDFGEENTDEIQTPCYHMLRCKFSDHQMKTKLQKKLYLEKSATPKI